MADNDTPPGMIDTVDTASSGEALDALFKQATTKTDDEPVVKDEPPKDAPKDEPKDEPIVDKDAPVVAKDEPIVDKDAPVVAKDEPVVAKDALDEVALPPYSKPKTGEAFEKVKSLARATIAEKDAELEKLRKEVSERDEKLKSAPAPEALKELEDLRNFRRSVNIESDPSFKQQFDGKIESNNSAIMQKLKDAGMSDEQLGEIKKLGGPDGVDWEPLLEKLPVQLRRFIEAKLVNNEELRTDRKLAVEQAKKDPSVFEKQRIEAQSKTIVDSANNVLKDIPWTAIKEVPANATPEQKAKIEADNAVAKRAHDFVQATLKDFTPEAFAELTVGTAVAYKLKDENVVLTKQLAERDASIKKIETERDALKTELDKIKKASRTHRANTTTPPAPVKNPFAMSGQEALDKLREEQAA